MRSQCPRFVDLVGCVAAIIVVLGGASGAAASAADLPDLVVTWTGYVAATSTVCVHNLGTADACDVALAEAACSGPPRGTLSRFEGVAAGDVQCAPVPLTRDVYLRVFVDPDDSIAEADESNNASLCGASGGGATPTWTATGTRPTETPTPSPTETSVRSPLQCVATATPTPAVEETPRGTASATASPAAGCCGDCDGNQQVTVDEIVALVEVALTGSLLSCGDCPCGQLGECVDVTTIVRVINNALDGCAAPPPPTPYPKQACGLWFGAPCCTSGIPCLVPDTICEAGRCVQCGVRGRPCCGGWCIDGSRCDGGMCVAAAS
ncbi:MAG TPA: CARDB domain-containing protein [Terriglobales bacterium]|nr:CARDB domain-containing protein [Terriglobales bacterium]